MRWVQKVNEDGTSRFVAADESARKADGHFIHANNMETFLSPVDGSLVRNKREYDEHNRKNNVVNAAEFTPEYYAKKAKERADFFEGRRSPAEVLKSKQAIYETITRAERNGQN